MAKTVKTSFLHVQPSVPSYNTMFMLEAMTYKVSLKCVVPNRQLIVEAWTSQCDRVQMDNRTWHALSLPQIDCTNPEFPMFGRSEVITGAVDFEFTFRWKYADEDDWHWYAGWQMNGFIHMEPPRNGDKWTQGPDFNLIINHVYLGNFLAATNAKSLGFTHVLNVAENLDLVCCKKELIYHKIPMKDGAQNPIDVSYLIEVIKWLKTHDQPCTKILVHCRAGIGRAGSALVAYVAYLKKWKFDEAYKFVFEKRFIYPHINVKQFVDELLPTVAIEEQAPASPCKVVAVCGIK